ncbi:LysR family transcriptional regulator [Gymnodinialimonas hymeniacidonis]|uniref:LysR family transcriptional regulator n=1 Tax=Gymnodinialimonas hymeniacidonis TaxID=3126508 RepID=UPI0034C5B3D9
MAKSLPPLTWFRSFEAAARHLSFTAAAEEVGLTQSAVSQQVKALETRLRVPLFTRLPRGLALTDDGRRLLPQVSASLDGLAAAADLVAAAPGEELLTVATSVSVAQWVIAPHLAAFQAAHPDARVRLLGAIWADDFNTARADVEVRFGSAKQAGEGAVLLGSDTLIALKAPGLQMPLEDGPLIEAVGTSSGWQAWREQVGPVGQPTLFTDTYGMALQMAAHGLGVALVSEVLAGHALKSGQVVRADPGEISGSEGYFLSFNDAQPAATAFASWLKRIV